MNTEQGRKQHLNLSCTAYEVIQNDLHAFGRSSLSGFLNGIFRNYYESADATIDLALSRKRQELMSILEPLSNSLVREQTCQLFLHREQERLLEQIKSYPKGYGFKFYLNVENASVLEENADFIAEFYQSRPALYLKAVIEEYAAHSQLQRERLFFHETIELLETCIEGGYLVTVETSGKRFDAKPWQIVPDESGLYHYLIALSCPTGEDPSQAIPASFRVSRITMVKKRPKSLRTGRLSLLEQERVHQALQERGVAFLVGKSEEIVVRLTEEGERLYQNKLFLRPKPLTVETRPDGTYYTFRCTPYQIQSYFLVFGVEAEILSPDHLRERFKRILRAASRLYDDPKEKFL